MTTPRIITRLGFAALACAPLSVALGEGSELPDGSVTITSLPFFDTGDTSDNLHDYDAVCPWASDSPEVFYAYTPPPDLPASLELYLCHGSNYDTKVYILNSAFEVIACEDDNCDTAQGGDMYASHLICGVVPIGETIYIAVDGWSGESGHYELTIESCLSDELCVFEDPGYPACPDGATDEAEPCVEDAEDVTNGGCNSASASFTPISCGDTICGTLYQSALMRDTDWFDLELLVDADVRMTAVGESELVFGRIAEDDCIPGAPDCSCLAGTVDPARFSETCEEIDVVSPAPAGRSWWFVATNASGAVPCGSEIPGNDYIVSWNCTLTGCCTIGDSNGDGAIDFADLVILLANWGPCGG